MDLAARSSKRQGGTLRELESFEASGLSAGEQCRYNIRRSSCGRQLLGRFRAWGNRSRPEQAQDWAPVSRAVEEPLGCGPELPEALFV